MSLTKVSIPASANVKELHVGKDVIVVQFKNGKAYQYSQVPQSTIEKFSNLTIEDSVGGLVHTLLKKTELPYKEVPCQKL